MGQWIFFSMEKALIRNEKILTHKAMNCSMAWIMCLQSCPKAIVIVTKDKSSGSAVYPLYIKCKNTIKKKSHLTLESNVAVQPVAISHVVILMASDLK